MTHNLTTAWLADAPRALPFLSRAFASETGRVAAVKTASQRQVPAAVLAAIVAQSAQLAPSPARDAHLEALAKPGTTTVVTGQQVGLFLGPLYTLYKAASAVAAARQLADETGHAVVPVFWIQNEDHDFDEICRVALPDLANNGVSWLQADAEPGDGRCAVASRAWSATVDDASLTLADALEGLAEADETSAMFGAAYTAGKSPCRSFIEVIAALFAADGLVIVDPSDPALASLAAPIHRKAVAEAAPIAAALAERTTALEAAGFKVQVHIRPGAPLSFYHPDGPNSPRVRIEPCPDNPDTHWAMVGTGGTVSTATLHADLESRPERFSTSALLRPILQDTWFPTVAYVGGPGELAYFGQLGPLYEAFGLPMPMPVLRGRFEAVDARARRLLKALSLSSNDLGGSRDVMLAKVGAGPQGDDAPSPANTFEEGLMTAITTHLAAARPEAEAVLGDLGRHFDKTETALAKFTHRLANRYRRAIATRDGVTEQRLDAVLAWFRPEGAPQERIYGAPWFLARFGAEVFMKTLMDTIVPFEPGLRTLDFTGSQGAV